MATRQNKDRTSGRTTPKGGAQKVTVANAATAKSPPRRNPLDLDQPVSVGRRPSSAGFLALVSVMWMAVGVVLFVTLSTSWRLVPAILAFGIGVMFLRGSVTTVLRRERRRSSGS